MTPQPLKRGMILAAGRGKRLRPLTDRVPKPLVEVGGIAMLDRALESLAAAGVQTVVVNTHHLAESLRTHLAGQTAPKTVLSHEPVLLETGGGIAHAIEHFEGQPFFVMNGDVVILDGPTPALLRLARAWLDETMDVLVLTQRTFNAYGYDGPGDFVLDPEGRVRRRKEREIAPYLFAGLQILHPRIFKDLPDGAFSVNLLFDRAIDAGRMFGIVHDGAWMHIGDMKALSGADRFLSHLV